MPPTRTARDRAVPEASWALVGSGVALIGTCYGLARFAYGLFAARFQADFELSRTLSGIIGAGSYVGYCVAIVASLVLTERLGARPVAVCAGAVATVGTATVALAPTAPVLAVGVLLAGSSTGLASPPMAAAVGRWVVAERQDRSQTVVNAGTGLGVLVSGPVALVLADQWRWAWALFAAIAAVVTVAVARSIPAAPPSARPSRSDRRAGPGRRPVRLLLRPGTGRLVLGSLLMGASSAAVWVFGRDLVTSVGSASELVATTMWTVLGAAGVVGALGGDLVARVGLARSWRVAMSVLAAGTALLVLAPASTLAIHLAAAVFGAAYIVLTALVLLWGTRVHPDHGAVGVGLGFLMIAVGQALGAPLCGFLIDRAGPSTAFLACAALGLLGAVVAPVRSAVAGPGRPAGVRRSRRGRRSWR